MRWLFLGLVIINALYFVWARQNFDGAAELAPALNNTSQLELDQVKLLGESVGDTRRQSTVNKSSAQMEIMLLGGFSDEKTAEKLQQRLLSLDINSQLTTLDSQVDVEYWVYLEPLASRQASVRQLKELQARKIDGYLITQGDLANGISLGMFSREDSAQGVAERLSAAGYAPLIRAVERSQRLYWVAIDNSARRLIDQNILQLLMQDFSDLKHLLMPSDKIGK